MAKSDVELTVRMRNEASKTVSTLTAALDKLTDAQGKVTTSAGAAGGALSKMLDNARNLMGQLDKDRAFDRMAADVIEATKAVELQEAALRQAQGEVKGYTRLLKEAAAGEQQLKAQLEQGTAALAGQKAELKEAEADLRRLQKTVASGSTLKMGLFPASETAALGKDVEAASKRVADLRAAIEQTSEANRTAKSSLTQTSASIRDFTRQQQSAVRNVSDLSASINEQKNAVAGLSVVVASARDAQNQLAQAQEQGAAAANRIGVAQRRAAIDIRSVAEGALTQSRDSFSGPLASIQSLTRAVQQSNAPLEQQKQVIQQLAEATNRAKAAPAELSTAISLLNKELRSGTGTAQSVNAAMANVDAAMKRTAQATQMLGTSMASANSLLGITASNATRAAAATQALASAETQSASAKSALNQTLKEYNDGARRSLDFTQRIRGQVLSLAAAYLGLQNAIGQIGNVITAFQSLEAAQNRLGAVFNGNEARVGQELDFLRRTADRLGISFQVLADEYGKFAVATNGTNLAGEETRKIFLAVAEAGRVNKLSLDNMQGTYLALTQMVSKGKVQSEELRRQLGDRLPGAFNIMAAALGKTTAELDKAMQNGEITSDALSKFADELQKRFGPQLEKSLTSTTTAIGRFQNQIYQTRLAFANAGFIEEFTEGLNDLNKSLASDEFNSFMTKVSVGAGKLASALFTIPEHMQAITVAAAAFIGLKLGGYAVSVAAGMTSLRTSVMAASTATEVLALRAANTRTQILAAAVATRSWSAALGLLGGPVGIAIAAITTAIGYWATRADSATTALNGHRRIVDQVKNSYEKAGNSADKWAESITSATTTQAVANLASVTAEYDRQTLAIQKSIAATREQARSANSPMAEADRQTILQTGKLVDQLAAREITLADFRKEIDKLAQATENPNIGRGLLALLESTNGLDETATAMRQAQLVITALTGDAKSAAAAMDELNGKFAKTDPVTDATAKLKEYQKVLSEISAGVPGMGPQAKLKKDLDDLQKKAAELVATVGEDPLGLPSEAQTIINKRIDAIFAEANKSILAQSPNIAKGVVERIMRVESSGNADARNKRSSAAGLGQFIDDTWVEQFTKVFPAAAATMDRAAILMYKTGEQNRDTQTKILENFTQENVGKLIQAGIAPTAGNTYLAHFLGAEGAIKVILANPNALAKDLVSAQAVSSNPTIFKDGLTGGGLQAWANSKMGGNNPLLDGGLTKQENEAADLMAKQETALKRIVKEHDERINKIKLSNTEAEIANALAETGLSITTKEGQALAQKIRDSRATADAEEKVNNLLQQRQFLQEQIKHQQDTEGNLTAVQTLQTQLQGVNTELNSAINNAIAMWQAIGGPQSEQAVLKLKGQQQTIQQTLTKNVTVAGVLTQSFDSIASAGTTAFTSVAESIWQAASGQISWNEALKQMPEFFAQMVAEVLLGIAKMIIQQTILNGLYMIASALGWYGPGASAAGSAVTSASSSSVNVVNGGIRLPTNHSGGLPGQSGTANFSTASILNALSYDSGGQRSLAPNETLSVLKEDEEVLTGTDPRHRRNGGAAGAQQGVQLKIINAIDAPSMLSAALDTPAGGQAVMNYLKANQARVKGILSM